MATRKRKANTQRTADEPRQGEPGIDEAPVRPVFTSNEWEYSNIRPFRDSCSIEMRNTSTGALAQMAVQSDAGPGYQASLHYEQILPSRAANVIREWFEEVRRLSEESGYAPPQPLPPKSSPLPLTISMEVESDPRQAHFRGVGRIRLADSLDAEIHIGGLHDSVDVTARGANVPFFLIGKPGGRSVRVEMVNVHRMGRFGGVEAMVAVRDREGNLRSEGISIPNRGGGGDVVIPLVFPGGTLGTPINKDGNRELKKIGDYLVAQIEEAVLTGTGAMLLSTNGKYKCLRSILTMFGACIICTIGMLGAAATGPGMLAAAALCFGSKAIAIINLILSHMGFDP